ncbi:MAG: peptide synthase, partial [Xanthomonadales bacterium]|nr:peptide synthase [Xanthomonadales bacterium]
AVLCVELSGRSGRKRRHRIETDLGQMALSHAGFSVVKTFLFHPGFPMDIRHNAKIGRERLALWAAKKLKVAA